MNPITLIIVIAVGVAIGIAASPYVGTFLALIGVALLVVVILFAVSILVRISAQQVVTLPTRIKVGLHVYFRAIPKAWNMLIGPSDAGDGLSIRRRLDGLEVLFVCLGWAVLLVAVALIFIYPSLLFYVSG